MIGLVALLEIAPAITAPAKLPEEGVCTSLRFERDLPVYKDPTLYFPSVQLFRTDPSYAWKTLEFESPVSAFLQGDVQLTRVGAVIPFSGLGEITRLYENVDPRFAESTQRLSGKQTMIFPVQVCGATNSYQGAMGFVLVDDFESAQRSDVGTGREGVSLPPSVYPNPIPQLPRLSKPGVAEHP